MAKRWWAMPRTFAALRIRNYRLYVAGQMASVSGTWMQKVAQAWLVLQLTGSGTALGVTAAIQQLPTLLMAPAAGLLADRVNRRKLLIWTQSLSMIPATCLGVAAATDRVTLWMVFVLAFVLGCIDAADKPARHTFVMDLVGPEHVTNAVSLNSVVQNAGKIVGPACAGLLIAGVGVPMTFFINAASYLSVVAALLGLRASEILPPPRAPAGRGQLREGFLYAWRTPRLRGPLILMALSGLLAYNWSVVLPLFAFDTFHGGPELVGSMFTAMGIGAIVGALANASFGQPSRGRLARGGVLFAVLGIAVAVAPNQQVALLALVGLGASSVSFRATGTSLLLLSSDPAKRGRVVALLVVAFNGTTPIGGPLTGWISDQWGVRTAFLVGVAGTLLGVGALVLSVRRDRPEPAQATATNRDKSPTPADLLNG